MSQLTTPLNSWWYSEQDKNYCSALYSCKVVRLLSLSHICPCLCLIIETFQSVEGKKCSQQLLEILVELFACLVKQQYWGSSRSFFCLLVLIIADNTSTTSETHLMCFHVYNEYFHAVQLCENEDVIHHSSMPATANAQTDTGIQNKEDCGCENWKKA